MGLRIEVDERDHLKFRQCVIVCDTCGAEVNDEQIKAGGGLIEMGWLRRFNNRPEARRNEYYCPAHRPE